MASISSYRNQSSNLSDDESSDSGSDNDCWKRGARNPTVPNGSIASSTSQPNIQNGTHDNKRRKINTIWSSVLEEQTVSDVLKDCELKHKPITLQDRNCESYDFRAKYNDPRESPERIPSPSMDVDGMEECDIESFEEEQQIKKHLSKQDIGVVHKIIRVLNEKKAHLIYRIVKVIGAEKAMNLLKKTEEVEDNGGIMVMNNSRRRTPGGVYIQLLKNDKNLTRKQKNTIFPPEENKMRRRKSKGKRPKKKKSKKETAAIVNRQDTMDINVPTTCPTPTTVPQQEKVTSRSNSDAESSEIEDGEILD